MKKMKNLGIGIAALAFGVFGLFLISADHIDAPAVTSMSTDITDFYAFQSPENSSNMVFVANVQGLLSPGATASAAFDENVMVEFNIDNDGDHIEDLVIQAIPRNGIMYVYGPFAPIQPGKTSTINTEATTTSAAISRYGQSAVVGANGAIKVFAGPRDDPFFFDLAAYSAIIGGTATSFNDPGVDAFAGTNVMSIVIEVPKSTLGSSGSIDTWVESKRKQ
jgi:hypothetical protein